ncbi:hypothetical protein JTB14_023134 [Gonioctena quinquepunctata]|nr:hypothetical protein JTB14_023134 [Gonioctena quinquepunctata]
MRVHFKDYHKAPKSNWTTDGGYSQYDGTKTYPRRALFAGAIFALEGILTVYDEEMDYVCGSSIQGFKVQIDHPGRLPRVRQQHIRIPLDQVIVAAVSPEITTTSEAIKHYIPKKRSCYFANERQLKYFKFYTQQNCQIECKTNHTLRSCGCINFYMPRNNDTEICSGDKINCIYESEHKMLLSGIDTKLHILREGKASTATDECDCMPICTSMYYQIENSQSPWDWRRQFNSTNQRKHMSYFQIFFKRNQFVTMDRNELFGATDFLANFGGLLGLFVGFSLLSLIEMFYYATLRIMCNIKLFGRRNWSGKTD